MPLSCRALSCHSGLLRLMQKAHQRSMTRINLNRASVCRNLVAGLIVKTQTLVMMNLDIFQIIRPGWFMGTCWLHFAERGNRERERKGYPHCTQVRSYLEARNFKKLSVLQRRRSFRSLGDSSQGSPTVGLAALEVLTCSEPTQSPWEAEEQRWR